MKTLLTSIALCITILSTFTRVWAELPPTFGPPPPPPFLFGIPVPPIDPCSVGPGCSPPLLDPTDSSEGLPGVGFGIVLANPSIVRVVVSELDGTQRTSCTGVIVSPAQVLTTGRCLIEGTVPYDRRAIGTLEFKGTNGVEQIEFSLTGPPCDKDEKASASDVTYNPAIRACRKDDKIRFDLVGTKSDMALIKINGGIDSPGLLALRPSPRAAGLADSSISLQKNAIIIRTGFDRNGVLKTSRGKITDLAANNSQVTVNGNLSASERNHTCRSDQGGGIFDANHKLLALNVSAIGQDQCARKNPRDIYVSIPRALSTDGFFLRSLLPPALIPVDFAITELKSSQARFSYAVPPQLAVEGFRRSEILVANGLIPQVCDTPEAVDVAVSNTSKLYKRLTPNTRYSAFVCTLAADKSISVPVGVSFLTLATERRLSRPTVNANSIRLAWNADSDVNVSYRAAIALGKTAPLDCTGTESQALTQANLTFSGLLANTRYSVRICSVNSDGVPSAGVTKAISTSRN